jgi:hypothetical protein
MSLVSCDGGEKDKNSKAENVLSENWSSEGTLFNRVYPAVQQLSND